MFYATVGLSQDGSTHPRVGTWLWDTGRRNIYSMYSKGKYSMEKLPGKKGVGGASSTSSTDGKKTGDYVWNEIQVGEHGGGGKQ